MREAPPTTPSWQTVLLLVAGVAIVVIIALLSAQLDSYLRRSEVPANGLPVVDLEATVAAGEIGTVYLPGEVSPTATLLVSPTPTPSAVLEQSTPAAAEWPQATAVSGFDENCGGDLHGWFPYIVKAEDTLSSLAQKSGLSENTIKQANCLTHDQIIAGQQILLRRPTTRTDKPAKPPWPIATPAFSPSS